MKTLRKEIIQNFKSLSVEEKLELIEKQKQWIKMVSNKKDAKRTLDIMLETLRKETI